MQLTLVPAYGRDYKSKKEVETDFYGGKDFTVTGLGGSGYVTQKELLGQDPKGSVSIRYKKLTQVVILPITQKQSKPK